MQFYVAGYTALSGLTAPSGFLPNLATIGVTQADIER
jgi:hypothetical protein